MAQCPKCGHKLRLFDIDQCCPECGVNMRLYGFEENFYHEAKLAELSQAGITCKIRRLKMSFIGSKLTIARLVVMLLPLAALFIPAGSVTVEVPFRSETVSLSLLGLYNSFTNGVFTFINSFAGADGVAEAVYFSVLRLIFLALAGIALLALAVFLTSVLGFISIKNMQKITCAVSALGIVASILSTIGIRLFASKVSSSVILSVSAGIGLLIAALAFAVVFVVNLMICKKGIAVEYDEGMVERSEIWKQVKSGKVNIDDLPYPVIETEATRKIQAEIEAERASYEKKDDAEEQKDESLTAEAEENGGENDEGKES